MTTQPKKPKIQFFLIFFQYENIIAGMKEETRTLVQQHIVEINNLKAKIGYEIQEREKERADHAAMMKLVKNNIFIYFVH